MAIHSRPRNLRTRASRLRREANIMVAPIAVAYRRRASELELEAEVIEESTLTRAA
ncbi:MAG: hypothetical protein ACI8Y4_000247 [Candidatus Poriferisodalaceae bacterium]|jgi:hypothetical protein